MLVYENTVENIIIIYTLWDLQFNILKKLLLLSKEKNILVPT